MKTNEAKTLARELLDQYGLQDWRFKIDTRPKMRLGQCRYTKREIAVSAWVFRLRPDDVEDTLRHELAHALAWTRDGASGHGWRWKKWCRTVGANPNRLAEPGAAPERKYTLTCAKCGDVVGQRHRASPSVVRTHRTNCCRAAVLQTLTRPAAAAKLPAAAAMVPAKTPTRLGPGALPEFRPKAPPTPGPEGTTMHVEKLYRVRHAALATGVAISTLDSAVKDGRCPSHKTACGLPLVKLEDAQAFAKSVKPYSERKTV